MARTNTKRARRGHTLIELVIAISTAGIVSLVAGSVLLEGSSILTRSSKRATLADNAARAMEQMLRYIREIEQDAGLAGQAQISEATATTLRFGANGLRLNGTYVELTTDNAANWFRACAEVTALTFTYIDKTGATLATLPLSATNRQNVRQVQVELQLTSVGQTHRIRSLVYLRNFENEAAG